ncbi:MAG: hypothetical protein JWN98_937 [Abditibacteriota bacterium]|nr:hypothetical protein [Abditibacteriota bacterium]
MPPPQPLESRFSQGHFFKPMSSQSQPSEVHLPEAASVAALDTEWANRLQFLVEADHAKQILRQNFLADGSRRENDAEHSWHVTLMALVLAPYAAPEVNLTRVLQMLLIHDIVEIDAGDTFLYDEAAMQTKTERELRAAERIFGLLPAAQAQEFRAWWDEFELGETPEASFAHSLDRMASIVLNHAAGGGGWKVHDIAMEKILERNAPIERGSKVLWEHAANLVRDAQRQGFIRAQNEPPTAP